MGPDGRPQRSRPPVQPRQQEPGDEDGNYHSKGKVEGAEYQGAERDRSPWAHLGQQAAEDEPAEEYLFAHRGDERQGLKGQQHRRAVAREQFLDESR